MDDNGVLEFQFNCITNLFNGPWTCSNHKLVIILTKHFLFVCFFVVVVVVVVVLLLLLFCCSATVARWQPSWNGHKFVSQLSGVPKQGSYITCKEARHHKGSIVPPPTISPLPLLYRTNIGTKAKHIRTKANNIGNYASKGIDTPLPQIWGGWGLWDL